MAIAKDTEDLTFLLYGKKPTKKDNEPASVEESVPVDTESTSIEAEPIFKYDPVGDKKTIMKTVRKTVNAMAEHILTEDILSEEYVKNKIEQDINTLTELYINRKNNQLVLQSLVEGISKGNTAPRMYEMYTKITDTVNENNKQILATEDNLRKTYMELKYEVQSKRAESIGELPNMGILSGAVKKEIAPQTYTGSKGILEKMKEKQRETARKNIQDVSFN